jgi:hypothetical protein
VFIKSKQELAEYAGRNCKRSAEVRVAIKNLEPAAVPRPEDPPDDATQWDRRIWDKMVDAWIKASIQLEQDLQRMYSVAMGQCTDALRAKLESQDGFQAISQASNLVGLLRMIRDISFNFQSQKYDVLKLRSDSLDTDKGSILPCPITWKSSLLAGTWSSTAVARSDTILV